MSSTDSPLLPEVKEFLSKEVHGGFINGQEVQASNGDTFETRDPGTGERLATVASLQAEDVDRAVDIAGKTFENAAFGGILWHFGPPGGPLGPPGGLRRPPGSDF